MPDYLKVKIDGRVFEAVRSSYVTAKTKQLREFGYTSLTESEVNAQIDLLLTGRKPSVIGRFMEDEIQNPKVK